MNLPPFEVGLIIIITTSLGRGVWHTPNEAGLFWVYAISQNEAGLFNKPLPIEMLILLYTGI